jgi:uncharacterized protein (DUF488 family)
MIVYSIGHSTRSFEGFVEILKKFRIEFVVDVRKTAYSKRFPHFSKANLQRWLLREDIFYLHFPRLGGFREEGYLVFSQSSEFAQAISELKELIDNRVVVVLCAEVLWWRCHRKYVVQALIRKGYDVVHILDKNKTQIHKTLNKQVQDKMQTKLFCDRKTKKRIGSKKDEN